MRAFLQFLSNIVPAMDNSADGSLFLFQSA